MIITINAEGAFDSIQLSSVIKTLSKLGTKESFLNLTSTIFNKSIANIKFNGEQLHALPLKL